MLGTYDNYEMRSEGRIHGETKTRDKTILKRLYRNKTCAGRPGSLGYEKNDANTYAKWGVDYLKYDNWYPSSLSSSPPLYFSLKETSDAGSETPMVRYPVMRDALNQTGREIFFSMCEWGVDNPATWAPQV
jgi:alpha-galactosidase